MAKTPKSTPPTTPIVPPPPIDSVDPVVPVVPITDPAVAPPPTQEVPITAPPAQTAASATSKPVEASVKIVPADKVVSSNQPIESMKTKEGVIVRAVRDKSPRTRAFTLMLLIGASVIIGVALAYLCWFVLIPTLWAWGFNPISWKAIFSALGTACLVAGPLLPFFFSWNPIEGIIGLYAEDRENKVANSIKALDRQASELQNPDDEELLKLIEYSRAELANYYTINLSETRKSYKSAIISMWIGFAVIIFGIMTFIYPDVFGMKSTDVTTSFQIITASAGVIIQLIGALFLWVYRKSMSQLTYFYNRQVFVQNALFAYKMASTLVDPSVSKALIIQKIMEFGMTAAPAPVTNTSTSSAAPPPAS